jgi:prefoldin subunit 5
MNTKEELVENIKRWVGYDTEIKNLQKSIKEIRQKKKELTQSLIDVMKNHEIDCFDINDGKLLYTKNKVKTPLNKNNLMIALDKYFKNQSVNVEHVTNFILDNREIKIKENLKKK